MMSKLILHLGVHKTATTHFQSRLYNSIPQLNKAGIGYVDLNKTREIITSKIHGDLKIDDDFKRLVENNEYVIISDENIIGGTEKITSELIYPEVFERLSFLIDNIDFPVDSVHLTIREPEAYLVSRYCEYLRHYRFMSVLEYFDSFDLKNFSWIPLLNAIEKIYGMKVRITVFENIFNDEDRYLSGLIGKSIPFSEASEGASIRRSKITSESYKILEHLADHYPRHMTIKLMNMMDNNKQRTKGSDFKPFSDDLSSKLKYNYLQDKLALGL